MNNNIEYDLLLMAAGVGKRSKHTCNKILLKLGSEILVEKCFNIFYNDPKCKNIIIIHNINDKERMKKLFSSYNTKNKKIIFTIGGVERWHSLQNGLKYVSSKYILIHDAARPFISNEIINNIINGLQNHNLVLPIVKIFSTPIVIENNNPTFLNNRNTYLVQSPCGFLSKGILPIFKNFDFNKYDGVKHEANIYYTITKNKPFFVDGDYKNIKITVPFDIDYCL